MGLWRHYRCPPAYPHRPLYWTNAGPNVVASLVFRPRLYVFLVARLVLKCMVVQARRRARGGGRKMWIVGVVTMTTVLASVLSSGATESRVDAGGLDRSASWVHAQGVQEPRIWLDRGVDPVLEAGDRVRIYYRTDADAYVAILQIDTDGTTRTLYPRSPTENHYARAEREYRLLFPRSAYWNVDDRPGVGYFFIVTSPTPFDFSDFGYSSYDGGWDLSAAGSTVYSDPYVAIDEYVARLVPDWEYVDYGLDFISYSVGGAHQFPRFMCYQCHGFRPYSAWNPYRYACVNFTVVVYDDPHFYPAYRYRAGRVVMVGPRNPARPRFEFKERARGDAVTVVRQGRRDDPPSVAGRPRTDQSTGRGRIASPPVAPPPTTTRRADPSDRGAPPSVRPDHGRVTSPPAGDRARGRPTLQGRSDVPDQSTRRPPEMARPRPSPQPPRPFTRRPDNPRAEPSARPPSQRPSTRRPSGSPSGSSSVRPAPRERSRLPPTGRGATAPSPRSSARTRAR
jgi:hypothetical protein